MLAYSCYQESAQYLRSRLEGLVPRALLILGSGLGFLGEQVEQARIIPYGEIPHFGLATAPGHESRLVCGLLWGVPVAVMQGRLHYYEGHTPEDIVYPLRVVRLLGAEYLVVTNAAGAINREFSVGDLMVISDHIRMMGDSPLRGPNLPQFGERFCDMSQVYDSDLQALALEKGRELGLSMQSGVYFYFPGPQFETPAEIRAARVWGGDAAGMSTVYEATAANHCGMRTLGLSLMTNMAAGVLNQPLSGAEVNVAAEKAQNNFTALIRAVLPELKKEERC